jgi:formyl-CoA transferase
MTGRPAATGAPLAGIRVVELASYVTGPYAAALLADMGARVVKIEEPGQGDPFRGWGRGGYSPTFRSVNRGKRSLGLDLRSPDGLAVALELVDAADVLVENLRPGALDRLGLGESAVRARNPRLVYCSISGFGESGPEAHRGGYDLIVQGESGVMDLTGFPDGPPVKVGNSIADLAAGTMAAHGIVLALFARERTGAGQKVEIAMLEVMAALLTYQGQGYLTTGVTPRRKGNQHPSIVPYEVFEAADAYLTVGVANNSLWGRFCQAIGHAELASDARFDTEAKRVQQREVLVPLLARIFRTAPAAEWLGRLERAGVPAGKIKSVGEALESEHLRARGAIVTVTHPTAGPMRMVGPPIRLHGTPAEVAGPAPLLGQHTDEVLTKLLGYSPEAVAQLRAAGVV